VKFLLDTQLLLWAAGFPEKLSKNARTLINNSENELFFSAASLWEVVIKSSLRKSDFQVDPRLLRRGLVDNGYYELPITSDHVIAVNDLPPVHKDPFDRILIAQSIMEGIMLVTTDTLMARYSGPIKKV